LSVDEIKARIEQKKDEAAGLLTDHGAVYAIEKELGISDGAADSVGEIHEIAKLRPGMNNVNILGVVKELRPVKKFKTERREGQLSRITLADHTGDSNVVLWDKSAEVANTNRISPGSIVLIRNAYTKAGMNNEPEIHVGGLSRMILDPKNLEDKHTSKLPKIKENIKKIPELTEGETASVHGRILYLYPPSEFDRPDGTKGQRSSIILEDEGGKVRVVLWDANAQRINDFSEGDIVKIEGAGVKENERGKELHISNRGRILPSDIKLKLPKIEQKTYKLGNLQPGLQSVDVHGRIVRILPIKEFTSANGPGKLASMVIADDTGLSRVVLWNEKADDSKFLNQGDIISVRNGYTKESLTGDTEIHLARSGTIKVNPEGIDIPNVAILMDKHAVEKKIGELGVEERNAKISGTIKDVEESGIVFEVCKECGSKVENVAGEWLCDLCGEVKPSYTMVLSCQVGDDSGEIRCVFYRDLAEQVSNMNVAEVMNIIGQSGDEMEPVRQIKNEIVGNRISLIGNTRYNEYFDRLDFIVSSISSSPVVGTPGESGKREKSQKQETTEKAKKQDEKPKSEVSPEEPELPEEFEVEEIKLDDIS